jgi:hypothetical protein
MPDRPGDIVGGQPDGPFLGEQGPDQGYGLRLASHLRPKIQLQPGEHADDVIRGCLGVALRRASLYSRAPVIHDFTVAFTIWGYYDADPPADLVELRRTMFEGLRHVGHHYMEARAVSDFVPAPTLRMTPAQVAAAYPGDWRTLVGA